MKEWQRPKTTRRYLHPPMSARLYTMWREGKIVFGENEVVIRNQYFDLVSAGLWFLDADKRPFDFHDAILYQREDGIPVHGLGFKLGECDLKIEGFSDFGRFPICFIKVRVENNTASRDRTALSFMLRTGKEAKLVFSAPDVYDSYQSNMAEWEEIPSTWSYDGTLFTDGERQLRKMGDMDFNFCEKCGIARAELDLLPGEAKECVFAFNVGEAPEADYAEHLAECVRLWEKELARINKLPASILDKAPVVRMIKNLAIQLMQCFTRSKGVDFVLARQGCLQRQVWVYETMPVLEALQKIGDFDDYIEPVMDVYFTKFASESGEITPLAIPWAMATGNVLYSFGIYTKRRGDKALFKKYRDAAYRAYLWMKNLRASVKAEPGVVEGLFPPLRSCDDELVFQSWGSTDTFNVRGLDALASAFEFFGDEAAAEIKAEAKSYRERIAEIWKGFYDAQKGEDLMVPFAPGVPDEVIMKTYHFSYPIAYFVSSMDLPMEDALRIINTYTKKGQVNPNGLLYDRMPDRKVEEGAENGSSLHNFDEDGNCIVWYVCCHEYLWFEYFLRHGDKERCEKILRGAEKFAMTDEFYMCERYNQRDPYFVPWSPNASANGRMINMLFDYYS